MNDDSGIVTTDDKPCCSENVFATGHEIAKMFRVSNSTVNLWKRQGMPYYGKSSCARFKVDEIIAWQKGQSELPVTKGRRKVAE